MPNPYEPPSIACNSIKTDEPHGGVQQPQAIQNLLVGRVTRWLSLILFFYPTVLVAALYGTWLVAWLVLGHMPRPSIDDPKYISVTVDVAYVFAGLLLVGFPAAAIIGIAMQLSVAQRSWLRRLFCSAVLIVVWGFAIAFLRWDPLLVMEWYMD